MLEDIKARILADVEPAPCGEDPTYHELYEKTKEERNKGGALAGSTDWGKIEQWSLELLGEVSKELITANSLLVALGENHGLKGLAEGLHAVGAFFKKYWHDMYPEPAAKNKRIKAMRWLNDRMTDLGGRLEGTERGQVDLVLSEIDAFRNCMEELNPEPWNPTFSDLRESLETLKLKLPEKPPERKAKPSPEPAPKIVEASPPPPAPSGPFPPPQAAVATPAPIQPAAPMATVAAPAEDASLEEQLEVLAKIAGNIRGHASHLPIGYRLARMALWADARMPRVQDGFETFIQAPNELVAEGLTSMASQGAWSDLLARCENLLPQYNQWLDLQYYAAMAAESLGPAYASIREIIESETCELVSRLPGLKDLKFNDGMAFASSQTKDWLEGLGAEVGGTTGVVKEDQTAALRSALRQHGSDKFGEALKEAQAQIDSAASPLAALRLRLEAAAFALEVNKTAWALSMLDGLTASAEAHQLHFWEPKLVARIWFEKLKAYKAMEESDPKAKEHAQQAMTALAALDVSLIARLT